ncbi:ATP-binding cassette domain-containing protein [Holosporaceae bacterium 'Namur']|nr:ATP-binding cassette domain-containing protein [Holosporaceae bacterium 'Namur']
MAENYKIVLENLSKSFGTKQVLKRINLNIPEQESLVVIGGSGSGKSVLIKTIMGLLEPDKESLVKIDGQDVTHIPIINRGELLNQFGMLFQGGALFDSLKIWENVSFTLLQGKNISRKEARRIAEEKLALVGLSQATLDLYPNELSGGMQKRAALARAIANNPSIIFFDEPTSGLDPITSQVIIELIANLSKELKATTITITHDMKCVKTIADKVAMIYKGEIIWQGEGKNIESSGNEYVDQFISGRTTGPITNNA